MARRKLDNCEDIKRYLGYLIRNAQSGKVNADLAGKLGYLCSILIKCIERSDIEKRLDEIEERLKNNELN